eukprot:symbB.v1.2.041062.t1/scaffold7792.1/size9265/1
MMGHDLFSGPPPPTREGGVGAVAALGTAAGRGESGPRSSALQRTSEVRLGTPCRGAAQRRQNRGDFAEQRSQGAASATNNHHPYHSSGSSITTTRSEPFSQKAQIRWHLDPWGRKKSTRSTKGVTSKCTSTKPQRHVCGARLRFERTAREFR